MADFGGIVAARCDYADQYKFQDKRSDVPFAQRDYVLVPSSEGRDAVLVVVDRADTGDKDRNMYLRFRTPGKLAIADVAVASREDVLALERAGIDAVLVPPGSVADLVGHAPFDV